MGQKFNPLTGKFNVTSNVADIAVAGGATKRLQMIRRTIADAQLVNSWEKPADGTIATVTSHGYPNGVTAPSLVSARNITGQFNYFGGIVNDNGTSLYLVTTTLNNASTFTYSGVVEMMTDATVLELGYQTGGANALVEIDGVLVSYTPTGMVISAGIAMLNIAFPSSKTRLVRVFSAASLRFIATNFGARYWAPSTDNVIRAVWMVDSYGSTGMSDISTGLCQVTGMRLGIRDNRVCSIGGTGWLNPGSGTSWKCGSHLFDATNANPDIVFFAYSNDNGFQTGLAAEIVADLTTVRAALPNALLCVLGAWSQNGGPSGGTLTTENIIATAVTTFNDPYCVYVPISQSVATALIYGTGKSGSPYSGNLSIAAPVVATTSATLTAPFTGPTTSAYTIVFSNAGAIVTVNNATMTNGSTAVTWSGAITCTTTAITYTHANAGNADIWNGGSDGTDAVHPNPNGHTWFYPKMLSQRIRTALSQMNG